MMVLLTSDAIITSNYVNKGSKVSIEEENERYRLNDSNLKTLEDSVHFYEDGMWKQQRNDAQKSNEICSPHLLEQRKELEWVG